MTGIKILLNRILNAAGVIIGAFLAMRILLRFFAANPSTPFVSWVYSVTDVLIYPFRGIFSNLQMGTTGGVVDLSAFVSLLAYGIILSLLMALVNALLNPIIVSKDLSSREHAAHLH